MSLWHPFARPCRLRAAGRAPIAARAWCDALTGTAAPHGCTPRLWARGSTVLLGGALLLAVAPRPALAHEIPERVAATVLVRAEGEVVRLLVRVPLEAMRDVDFPLRPDGTLELTRMSPLLVEAAGVWLQPAFTVWRDGDVLPTPRLVAARVSMPSDRAFTSYAEALAHVRGGELDPGTSVHWQQLLFDVLLEVPAGGPIGAATRFAVEPALAHLGVRTVTVLRFVQPDAGERVFTFTGDPGRVELDPRWWQAARTFVALGFTHILDGIDHLLFVCCLVIPVRRWRPLVAIVSAFTVAHSITLATAVLGFTPEALWFPPLVETLIAGSIVFMAAENVLRPVGALERRWPMAFAFGLVHGFGFSFALQETLQLAGGHLVASLAAFNVGVELGQLLVLAVVVPVLAWGAARVARPVVLAAVLSALVGHTAWHWMSERFGALSAYDLSITAAGPVFWLGVLRLALLAAVSLAVAWGLSGVFDRLSGTPEAVSGAGTAGA
jgi:hypothetical protein